MRRDMRAVVIPFPRGLMSTARSSLAMGLEFGTELRNLLAATDGAGRRRGGVVAEGGALGGEVIVHVMSFVGGSGGMQLLVVTDAGKIYLRNGAIWTLQRSGLNTLGVPRSVWFAGRLLLCNGFDDVLAYDGVSWSVVQSWVVEAGSGLTFVAANQLRVNSSVELYPIGGKVRARLGTTLVEATVSAVAVSGAQLTITLVESVLTSALNQLSFAVKPPKVAFLLAAHDRLWGLGRGPLVADGLRGEVDRLRVYYSYGVNDHSAWPDPVTGVVPSVNLADKAGVVDELVAMAVQDGLTVFLGRNHVQLWSGMSPAVGGDFSWVKTIPVGCWHGGLVAGLPNDLLLLGRQGVRTLSRTLQTEQLDVRDVGSELDPTLLDEMREVAGDAVRYRRCVAFGQPQEGWYGLSLGGDTFVFQVSATGQGWVVFDGAFKNLTAAHVDAEGRLWLAKEVGGAGQVYRYDPARQDDAGAPIVVRWQTPWLVPASNGRRWANRYVEVLSAQPEAVTLAVQRWVDYDLGNPTIKQVEAPAPADFWESAQWDAALWDNATVVAPLVRDHAVGQSFAMGLESVGGDGALTIFGLKLYGRSEQ